MEEEERKSSVSSETSRQPSTSSGLNPLKKIPESEVMACIQIGVEHSIKTLTETEPERDLLVQDFMTFESVFFPAKDSLLLPAHAFKFLNYAPIAFKYFRGLFQIQTETFISAMCSSPLRQLENPGSSGSIFYLTHDDCFILKTVQHREAEFLLKLLPGYYLNLTQNPRTLLPKFFGFYSYSNSSRHTRVIVMNNLIPSSVHINQKYDLKGSTSKRKASVSEIKKTLPTYKDLDFLEHHPGGLLLDVDVYKTFLDTLERDCRVLESFKIIDYSLLLAVHYVDKKPNVKKFTCSSERNKEPTRGIPGRTTNGEEVLLFIGIIDILQSYHLRKKFEHTIKSIIYEKDSISVHKPDFYSQRFQNFISKTVFKPISRRKTASKPSQKTQLPTESEPSCSGSKLVEGNPLSEVWVSSKSKFSNVKNTSVYLEDEKKKFTPVSVYRSDYDVESHDKRRKSFTVDETEVEDKTGNECEFKPPNVVPIEVNNK